MPRQTTPETSNRFQINYLDDKQINNLFLEIDELIQEICTQCDYDVHNISLHNWLYILACLNKMIFKPRPELLYSYTIASGRYTQLIPENISRIYDIYSTLCDKYGVIKRKRHFFTFVGVNRGNLYTERDGTKKILNSLQKKLEADCEESTVNAALADRGNPVKYLAILNHDHFWDVRGSRPDPDDRPRATLADLPDLSKSLELTDNLPRLTEPPED